MRPAEDESMVGRTRRAREIEYDWAGNEKRQQLLRRISTHLLPFLNTNHARVDLSPFELVNNFIKPSIPCHHKRVSAHCLQTSAQRKPHRTELKTANTTIADVQSLCIHSLGDMAQRSTQWRPGIAYLSNTSSSCPGSSANLRLYLNPSGGVKDKD